MESVDTLMHARWLVPVDPRGAVLERHAVAVRGGRIVALSPSETARERFRATETVDLPRHVLIPGLVNAHTHAAMTLLRGLADDLPLMTWLEDHIWPVENRWAGAEFVRDGAMLAIAEMLASGTTCVNDMYFFPEAIADAVHTTGIRACLGLVVFDAPTSWGSGPEEYFAKGHALYEARHGDPLLSFSVAPHAPYTVSDRWLREVRAISEELGLRVHMHVHETAGEVAESVERYGKRPIARLRELGLFNDALLAVHMTQLTDEEIALSAEAGVHVLHCPESNLKLASGLCPVARLLDAGVNVALGTDGAASNNDLDMFGEMRTAALLAKGVASNAAALPAESTLDIATMGGARALGLDTEIGSITVGKSADLVAVDLSAPSTQPVHHVISTLVYSASRDQVTDVWVQGKRLVESRALTTIDVGEVLERTDRWRTRIGAR